MSGTCKACNATLSSREMGRREVEVEGGGTMLVQEDMCRKCRREVFVYYDNDADRDTIHSVVGTPRGMTDE